MKQRPPPLHAVILAGGAGERFWPASRRHYPKPFLRVLGGDTLLEATLKRARRFAAADRIWIVCGNEHAKAIRAESGLAPSRILVEPERRNTAMAVAWASIRLAAEDDDAVMVVLSADHHIPDTDGFARAVRTSARAAHRAGVLVTLGVKPTRPDTGYGYIAVGKQAGREFAGLHEVERFVEKPDSKRAEQFLAGGRHLWNAGVFVWSASALLGEIESCAPKLHATLAPLRDQPKGRNAKAVASSYRKAPSLPIDTAVMEVSRKVWTLPVDFVWSDVGAWASLAEQLGVGELVPEGSARRGAGKSTKTSAARKSVATRKSQRSTHIRRTKAGKGRIKADAAGNRILGGEVLIEGARSNLIWGGDRLIALLDVEDLAVIDTNDVILITKLDGTSDVRKLVATLKLEKRDELT